MIAILLSTYNGEKYISAQLDSIINQTYQDFQIYIRDDGSTDNTEEIISQYHSLYPDKIVVIEDLIKHRGANHSFLFLLQTIESDYYMFCDQDDIWLPEKIQLSIDALKNVEAEKAGIPILIHTDMKVVDCNLSTISTSLYKSMRIHPKIIDNSFNFMGVCSCGPGCSMLFNAKAKELSLRYDDLNDVPMHDWWIAINTVKKGKIVFLPTPTMLYRQHQTNTVGASNVNLSFLINKFVNLKQTLAPYDKDMIWLRKVGYGSKVKYLFYKLLYYIIRIL